MTVFSSITPSWFPSTSFGNKTQYEVGKSNVKKTKHNTKTITSKIQQPSSCMSCLWPIQHIETDYQSRLGASSLLVIGATGYQFENELFGSLDPNYLPVGGDYMKEKPIASTPMSQSWSIKFWENLSNNLQEKKFSRILIDRGTKYNKDRN